MSSPTDRLIAKEFKPVFLEFQLILWLSITLTGKQPILAVTDRRSRAKINTCLRKEAERQLRTEVAEFKYPRYFLNFILTARNPAKDLLLSEKVIEQDITKRKLGIHGNDTIDIIKLIREA